MNIRELTNQEFKNFTDNFYMKSIYQTLEYGFTMNEQKYDTMFIGLINDGVVIAASLILIKKELTFKYAIAPRGFLIKYEDFYLFKDFTEKLKTFLNSKGIVAIKINPMIVRNIYDFKNQIVEKNKKYDLIFESLIHNGYNHLGYNDFFEAIKPRFVAKIDLTKQTNELFKNVKRKYRTKIRNAARNGIEIIRGTGENLNYLYEFTKNNYFRKLSYFKDCYGYFYKNNKIDYFYTKLNTQTYLKNIQKRLNEYESLSTSLNEKIVLKSKNNPRGLIDKKINIDKYLDKYKDELIYATKLLRDNPDGIITSAILTIKHGDEITVLIDGYDKKYSRLNSKHVLIWELIVYYKKQGYTKFNLGGVSNMITDINSKYIGLNEFKTHLGAEIYEYAGDFELVINKMNYNLYRNSMPLRNLLKSKLVK